MEKTNTPLFWSCLLTPFLKGPVQPLLLVYLPVLTGLSVILSQVEMLKMR